MISIIKIRHVIVAAVSALVFAATPPAILAQATEAPATDEAATATTLDAVVEVEIQQRFIELQRQYLDDRLESIDRWAETVTWWLAGVAIVFTALGIILTLNFRHKAREAIKKSLESANKASAAADKAEKTKDKVIKDAEETEYHKQKSKEVLQAMRTVIEKVGDGAADSAITEQPEKTVENIPQSHKKSVLKEEIKEAVSLKKSGETEKAIEKWRTIASFAKEIHKNIAVHAWLQVASLEKDVEKQIRAYSESLHINPTNSSAFYYRGIAKAKLERYPDAIEDYDEAIRLDEKHIFAHLYRGLANMGLGRTKKTLSDFQIALNLAKESGNKEGITIISDAIQDLKDAEQNKQD